MRIDSITRGSAEGFMNANVVRDSDSKKGIHLWPGDVIQLRRWSAGSRTDSNVMSPPSFVDRIPLRNIPDGARLHDIERQFLLDAINTNRREPWQSEEGKAIASNEIAMWQAFVDSLKVLRVNGTLVASFDQGRVLDAMRRGQKSMTARSVPPQASTSDGVTSSRAEITGLTQPYAHPALALSVPQTGGKNEQYYMPNADFDGRMFTFLAVDLQAVDTKFPGGEESSWTLKELEDSDVYRGPRRGHPQSRSAPLGNQLPRAKIVGIVIPGAGRSVWVRDNDATYSVKRTFSQNMQKRSIERNPGIPGYASCILPTESLDALTVADVSKIIWDIGNGQTVRCASNINPYDVRP